MRENGRHGECRECWRLPEFCLFRRDRWPRATLALLMRSRRGHIETRGGTMSFSTGPSPADEIPHTLYLSSLYCPGCAVGRDPLQEVLTIHWCDEHRPSSDGVDDVRTTLGRAGLSALADAEGDTN